MAIRIDNSADGMTRTAGMPSTLTNSTWTISGWVYFVALPGSGVYHALFGINTNNTVRFDFLYVKNQSGVTYPTVQVDNGAYNEVTDFGITFSASTWYHMALVRSSNTSLVAYINGTAASANTTNQSANTGTLRLEIGSFAAWSDTCSARFAAFKHHSAALSAAEILQEMRTIRPQRLANLSGWYPMFPGASERLVDYSGNGQSLTEVGTLTDEDPPPISYGGPSWAVIAQGSGSPPAADAPKRLALLGVG